MRLNKTTSPRAEAFILCEHSMVRTGLHLIPIPVPDHDNDDLVHPFLC